MFWSNRREREPIELIVPMKFLGFSADYGFDCLNYIGLPIHPSRSDGRLLRLQSPYAGVSHFYRVAQRLGRGVEEPVTFSIFSCFLHSQPVVFKPLDKAVILSGAPHRWIG